MIPDPSTQIHAVVIIPAYEPPPEFYSYAESVSQNAAGLIVVDDGSGEAFSELFGKIARLPRTKLISYDKNMGKGYALKQAFRYAVDTYPKDTVLVTADCDGQHIVSDVQKVAARVEQARSSLVLGTRNFDLPNVPVRSRAGNIRIRRMYRLFYGLDLSDTQTGLRGFTVATARKFLAIRGNRFEFESAMLIYAQRRQIPILEEPITTVYPEDPQDHVSHFHTFRDTFRILRVMFGNLFDFIGVAVISAAADILVFNLFLHLIFPDRSPLYSALATVIARVFSSVLNFLLNCKTVFHGRAKRAVFRYYLLWGCQLASSYGILYLFSFVIGWPQTPVKLVGDLLLSLISYQIQCRWVYRRKEGDTSGSDAAFWGVYARLAHLLLRVFYRRYRCDRESDGSPVLYVCRHRNMHGPIVTLASLDEQVHPMVLSVFTDRKSCERQFTDYTFSVRKGKAPKKKSLRAAVAAAFVTPLVRSLRAIPVYRGSAESLKTLRSAEKTLRSGESVIVYPDVDYTGKNGGREIYRGFLYVGELYYKKTGEDLPIVALYIDEQSRIIRSSSPIFLRSFREDGEEAARRITDWIYDGRSDESA